MKKLILSIICLLMITPFFAQEEEVTESAAGGDANIADIMNLDAVNASSEDIEALEAEYKETFDKEKGNCESNLSKLGESYKKDVQNVMNGFSKTLEKGVKKTVDNEKSKVGTQVHSLTVGIRSKKKKEVVAFSNKMNLLINKLPRNMVKKKQDELKEVMDTFNASFDEEYEGNQAAIAGFKAKEHLLEGDDQISETPTEAEGEGEE